MSAAGVRRAGEADEIIRALRTSTNAEQVAAFVAVLRVALDRGVRDARDRQFPVPAPPRRPTAEDRRRGARTHRTV